MQRGVARAPLLPPLLGLVQGHRLRGEPGIVGVLRADLDVRVADYRAVVTMAVAGTCRFPFGSRMINIALIT